MDKIKVFAPATVANLACGFDILGLALNSVGDEVIISKKEEPGITISAIHGAEDLPKAAEKNVAGVSAQALIDSLDEKPDYGFDIELFKKVAPGSGLGSSASSSAAAVFAVNQLLGEPYQKKELVKFAMEGERAASGVAHADNVAPSLLGGFTLIRSYNPLDVVQLQYPKTLYITVIHPQIEVKTADSKRILRKDIPLDTAITQWGNVGGLVSGLASSDFDLIGRSLVDVVAEPVRSMLIPLFNEAKSSALENGALGCSISGSGPSIFALSTDFETAEEIASGFSNVYLSNEIEAIVYVSSVNATGAEVIE